MARFESLTASLHIPTREMDTALEQSIASALTSAVTTALASLRAKHDDDIQSLREMLQKAFPSKESRPPSPDAQALSDAAINPKATSSPDLASKGSQER